MIGTITNQDDYFLSQALSQAENGLTTTMPNPRVGCVIVKQGQVIADGWHQQSGQAHAEIIALNKINHQANNADVYVSLSPCCHQGQTPPCVDAIIQAGAKRVVIALLDPYAKNPQAVVSRLSTAGIKVAVLNTDSPLAQRAFCLNVGFFSRLLRHRPWLRLKIAATIDGKTALQSGLSRWITKQQARVDAHRLRAQCCAIVTGIGTALADNPALTVRHIQSQRQPLRVLIDSKWRLSTDMKLFADNNVLVATAINPPKNTGDFQTVSFPDSNQRVDLVKLLHYLSNHLINEVIVEAGRVLNGAFLMADVVDEIVLYMAPRLFGENAKDMFAFPSLSTPDAAPTFEQIGLQAMTDGDIKVTYRCQRQWQALWNLYLSRLSNPHNLISCQ